MEVLIKIIQLLLSLSILVIFHEMGHFIAARVFKTRVEKFYLFFDPWFRIFRFRHRDTEYGMGWLPLGGYVKISGMIDESLDKEQMKLPPQPWEFRSKPAWQRLIIMLGGVIVNVLLAMLIYVCILFAWGEQYLPTTEVNKYGISCDTLAMELGLQNGDRILSVDHKPVADFQKIIPYILLEEATTIQVIREGQPTEVNIQKSAISKLLKQENPVIWPRIPFEVAGFAKESPGEKAGLKLNDHIIGLNGISLPFFTEFRNALQHYKLQEVILDVIRAGDTIHIPVAIPETGLIGVQNKSLDSYFTFQEKEYTFLSAIPAGITKAFTGIGNYLKSLKLLFSTEKAYESVGGFITMGKIFPSYWDWQSFWGLTAFLSIMLAILNVLPIPGLDGGHVLFLLFEIVTGRKPSDKFLEYAQIAGMIMLFALLIFANGNDILRLIRK
ncbi:MAG: RIP metalloprotease RseP [Bacteroidales bacterium]|nr:RIP metalloprotease RseP [Lentimicrobiaceae bacterium]MDD5694954.1 RIP metalloprotease RseP [Bacteroidales bacterium]